MYFAFVYNHYDKYKKLGPKGKKCIFIRYSEQSKGHVIIDEQDSGMVTEFELRDVTFLENKFSKQAEIGQDLSLYETEDQTASAIEPKMDSFPSKNISNDNEPVSIDVEIQSIVNPLDIYGLSGSNSNIDKSSYQSQPRRTSHPYVFYCHFENERKAFIVTPQDKEELRNVNEALTCSAKDK